MPTVMTRSCSNAVRPAKAIFQVRKYRASTIVTRMRNTTSPWIACSLTEAPQLGPMSVELTLAGSTSKVSASAVRAASVCACAASVWTRTVLPPTMVVVTEPGILASLTAPSALAS